MSPFTSESKTSKNRLERLPAVIEGKKSALIISHTNPDPDAIASALAFQYLLSEIERKDQKTFFGRIRI